MSNWNKWKEQDKKVKEFEKSIEIPNAELDNVPFVILKSEDDFEKIPKKGGCYWVVTNEPIIHKFHKHGLPKKMRDMEIIYNGVAKDNVHHRIKQHLLINKEDPGWSAIRIDLLLKTHRAYHRQKAMSIKPRTRVPYFDDKEIRKFEDLLKLNLSQIEIEYVLAHKDAEAFHFKNGINIFDEKHKNYDYKVYFIADLKSITYLDFIEKKWREQYGLPKLCSYLSGR
ncbi:MAG: hypothetical protein V3V33_10265 [Candidatus Lokiarchaeia archaeon]